MAMNRIQFQASLFLPAFLANFGADALEAQEPPMQVLPVADISDRRHLVPTHPLVVKHLFFSNLSGLPRPVCE